MGRPTLEVADIFLEHGPAWREAQRGHLSLPQLKVMSAITQCRTAALGGHVLRCEGCATDQVAYNSCRNRHCPKCRSTAAKRWLDARQADLLPVEYYHVVFTLPAPIADLAYQNKAVIYGILFDVAAEVLQTIAADPKHLGARIGATLVLRAAGYTRRRRRHKLPAPDRRWCTTRRDPRRAAAGDADDLTLQRFQQFHAAALYNRRCSAPGVRREPAQVSYPYLWWSREDLGIFERWLGIAPPGVREETLINLVAVKPAGLMQRREGGLMKTSLRPAAMGLIALGGLLACDDGDRRKEALERKYREIAKQCVTVGGKLDTVSRCLTEKDVGAFYGPELLMECSGGSWFEASRICGGIVLTVDWRETPERSSITGWRVVVETRSNQAGWIPR